MKETVYEDEEKRTEKCLSRSLVMNSAFSDVHSRSTSEGLYEIDFISKALTLLVTNFSMLLRTSLRLQELMYT